MTPTDKPRWQDAVSAVKALAAVRADNRPEWVDVGMAINAIDASDQGFELFDSFSQRSDKYKAKDTATVWRSFKQKAGGVGAGTLFKLAAADGWQQPKGRKGVKSGGNVGKAGRSEARPPCSAPEREEAATGPHSQATKYIWATPEIAAGEFAKLVAVNERPRGAKGSVWRWLWENYALDPPPAEWRHYNHARHGECVAYPGRSPAGVLSVKIKSIERDEKGKRRSMFLTPNDDGAILLERDGEPLVIVGGEEKAALAYQVGFSAWSSLSGEKAPTDVWIKTIIDEIRPPAIVLANDADEAGQSANEKTAEALEAAGFPARCIAVVDWPEGAPAGFDLNDLAKQDSPDAAAAALTNASAYKSQLPACLSAAAFMAKKRPPLKWHILDWLPYRHKLTFSAPSKFGKSMWAIQAGLALAAGHCKWLGLQFGPPARVLYFQAEIMDALLEVRLKWIFKTLPAQIDRHCAMENFIIQEIEGSRPNFLRPEARQLAETLIRIHKPNIIILDPLAGLCPGYDENNAGGDDSMGVVLDYFMGLTDKYNAALILIHHHSKGGGSRGSSVFEGWGDTDLQAFYLNDDEDDRDVAKIKPALRCAFGEKGVTGGPIYWKFPTKTNAWFELMPEDWEPVKVPGNGKRRAGRQSLISWELLLMTLRGSPGGTMKRGEILIAIEKTKIGVTVSTIDRALKKAVKENRLLLSGGYYSLRKEDLR